MARIAGITKITVEVEKPKGHHLLEVTTNGKHLGFHTHTLHGVTDVTSLCHTHIGRGVTDVTLIYVCNQDLPWKPVFTYLMAYLTFTYLMTYVTSLLGYNSEIIKLTWSK